VFSQLANIWRVHDLRNKLLFVVAMVAVYRLGVFIRVPGVDPIAIEQLRESAGQQGALGFLNLFSGGAFESFSIFALGIMPYITASIIMQVLGVVIPKLEELQSEGAVGQRKITQYTRYVTMGLATLQATGLVFIFGTGRGTAFFSAASAAPTVPLLPDGVWPRGYLIIPTLVAGTAVLMWMAELISQRGIGNGMSMIIFASVVASLPGGFWSILQLNKVFWFVAMVLDARHHRRRRVRRTRPTAHSGAIRQTRGRPSHDGWSEHLHPVEGQPVRRHPDHLRQLHPAAAGDLHAVPRLGRGLARRHRRFVDQYIVNPQNFVYVSIFAVMIIAFAYFYNSIAFDPVRQADQLRRQGGFIPGVRPGPQTERYLGKAVNRITLPGAVFIAIIAVLPYILLIIAGISTFGFAGTSVLISVGVALELMRQIDSQLTLRNYEGFLK
jgi:preprotein translocase subunit SecY